MLLDTEFFSYNGVDNLSLRRYYKRDWSGYGNASGIIGHNQTLGFNCVHSSDNLDKILSDLKIKGFMKKRIYFFIQNKLAYVSPCHLRIADQFCFTM